MSGRTWTVRLSSAPFPYDGTDADGSPFFQDADQAGRRLRRTATGAEYPEAPHFVDDHVLLHIPRSFDAAQRPLVVLFFHGHDADIATTVAERLEIPRQVDESETNALLVAPQLALKARESHPGKLVQPGAATRLLDGAAAALAEGSPGIAAGDIRAADIVLAAFSGGYYATAMALERGGIDERVRAVILFDALYGALDAFEAWLVRRRRRDVFVALSGEGTAANSAMLAARLRRQGVVVSEALPGRFEPGAVHLARVETGHWQVPVAGPPYRPLAELLRRLG